MKVLRTGVLYRANKLQAVCLLGKGHQNQFLTLCSFQKMGYKKHTPQKAFWEVPSVSCLSRISYNQRPVKALAYIRAKLEGVLEGKELTANALPGYIIRKLLSRGIEGKISKRKRRITRSYTPHTELVSITNSRGETPHLPLPQVTIYPPRHLKQFTMSTLLYYLALAQDNNPVHLHDSRQPMGYNYQRLAIH